MNIGRLMRMKIEPKIGRLTDPLRQKAPNDWRSSDGGLGATWNNKRVYVMRAEVNGDLKIGIANSVLERHRDIQAAHSHPVTLLLVLIGGIDLEVALYLKFASHRLLGEWYRPHPELIAWVEAVRTHLGNPFYDVAPTP